MSALSSAYWSDLCASSFDRRSVSQFQRILYPVGGTTVSALVCAESDAFIYLASPCLHALALNHHPSHIHSHLKLKCVLAAPHATPVAAGLRLLLHSRNFPRISHSLPSHEPRVACAPSRVGIIRNIQVRVSIT